MISLGLRGFIKNGWVIPSHFLRFNPYFSFGLSEFVKNITINPQNFFIFIYSANLLFSFDVLKY